MDSLLIQDAFRPYYSGREVANFARPQLKVPPARKVETAAPGDAETSKFEFPVEKAA